MISREKPELNIFSEKEKEKRVVNLNFRTTDGSVEYQEVYYDETVNPDWKDCGIDGNSRMAFKKIEKSLRAEYGLDEKKAA
jgi:hypothetical protein